jgi:hypothetical protein
VDRLAPLNEVLLKYYYKPDLQAIRAMLGCADFAALPAISLRCLADTFFIRALADLRTIADKCPDSLSSITKRLTNAQRLSINIGCDKYLY